MSRSISVTVLHQKLKDEKVELHHANCTVLGEVFSIDPVYVLALSSPMSLALTDKWIVLIPNSVCLQLNQSLSPHCSPLLSAQESSENPNSKVVWSGPLLLPPPGNLQIPYHNGLKSVCWLPFFSLVFYFRMSSLHVCEASQQPTSVMTHSASTPFTHQRSFFNPTGILNQAQIHLGSKYPSGLLSYVLMCSLCRGGQFPQTSVTLVSLTRLSY